MHNKATQQIMLLIYILKIRRLSIKLFLYFRTNWSYLANLQLHRSFYLIYSWTKYPKALSTTYWKLISFRLFEQVDLCSILPYKIQVQSLVIYILHLKNFIFDHSRMAVVAHSLIPHFLAPLFNMKYPFIPHLAPQLFLISQ